MRARQCGARERSRSAARCTLPSPVPGSRPHTSPTPPPLAAPASPTAPVGALQWLHVFRKSIPAYTKAAGEDPSLPEGRRQAAAAAFAAAFGGVLDALGADPTLPVVDGFTTQPLNCSTLCRVRCAGGWRTASGSSRRTGGRRVRAASGVAACTAHPWPRPRRRPRARVRRDEALARAGCGDVFKPLKDRESAQALALLPSVLAELDSIGDPGAWQAHGGRMVHGAC